MRIASIALFSGLLLSSGLALAQKKKGDSPPAKSFRDELPEDARAAWDRGKTLSNGGNPSGACGEFTKAFELSKNPKVLLDIAICEKDQAHYTKAIHYMEREKLEGAGKVSADELAQLEQNISVLRKYTTTLTVEVQADPKAKTSINGAKLFIDGEEQPGMAPFLKPFSVDIRDHMLVVKKEGFDDESMKIDSLNKDGKYVTLTLKPRILVEHTKATIYVTGPEVTTVFDGEVECGIASPATPCKMDVEVGKRHTFRARGTKGFKEAFQSQDVSTKDPVEVHLNMTKAEARVSVDVTPADAVISLDGKDVGSKHWDGPLEARGYTLRVTKPGYLPYSAQIQIDDGKNRTVQVSLVQDSGKNTIFTVLGAAAVVAGGGIASYFIFRSGDPNYVNGTLNPYRISTPVSK